MSSYDPFRPKHWASVARQRQVWGNRTDTVVGVIGAALAFVVEQIIEAVWMARGHGSKYPAGTFSRSGHMYFAAAYITAGLLAGLVGGFARHRRSWDSRLQRRSSLSVGLPYLVFLIIMPVQGDLLMSIEYLSAAIVGVALGATVFARSENGKRA